MWGSFLPVWGKLERNRSALVSAVTFLDKEKDGEAKMGQLEGQSFVTGKPGFHTSWPGKFPFPRQKPTGDSHSHSKIFDSCWPYCSLIAGVWDRDLGTDPETDVERPPCSSSFLHTAQEEGTSAMVTRSPMKCLPTPFSEPGLHRPLICKFSFPGWLVFLKGPRALKPSSPGWKMWNGSWRKPTVLWSCGTAGIA